MSFNIDPGKFLDDESGAVTIDWVVLTAVVCTLAILAGTAIKPGVTTLGQKIDEKLTAVASDVGK
ncbi:hypothetical protein LV82_01979 [Albidovulum inexpectatum]|uniref:Pilus assembly protein Flp/PilA n=1 Tax=Albidovulum inexpectatum TaxID=196587 RepID=A0A2S5JGS4_9RHOB|nr:hypothetical protein [Albidovulum inexpectatum]PPB80630.1 hypothetical protein LV82_01979 [Albidovulum inexpectatum]